jgi:tetrapyrrole methylase family protein/MazG family protein
MEATESFKALYDVIARLRGPGGCPWDLEQTPSSLRGDLTEEVYECIEAIDEKNSGHIAEELGDIYLLVTMLSYMHEEEGLFTVADVLNGITEKLIRRHPHVFGDVKFENSAEVLANWAKIKVEKEGRKPKDSVLDEVSSGLHPLERAYKLQKKAAKAGFDWPDKEGVITKIREELDEAQACGNNTEKLEEELGDLLFSVVNLCRYCGVEPSLAIRRTNGKFVNRFSYVEKKMKEAGLPLLKENIIQMDKFWNDAKKNEMH